MKLKNTLIFVLLVSMIISLSACQNPTLKLEWVDDEMGELKAPDMTIVGKIAVNGGFLITFTEMELDQASLFINALAMAGFTLDPTTEYTDTKYVYSGTNSSGFRYEFDYNIADKSGSIKYIDTSISGGGSTTAVSNITTDTTQESIQNMSDWDTVKMGGLPEPQGIQFDQLIQGMGWTQYFSKADPAEISGYFEIAKASGYSFNTSVENTAENDYYYGHTERGDELYIMYSIPDRAGYMTVLVLPD